MLYNLMLSILQTFYRQCTSKFSFLEQCYSTVYYLLTNPKKYDGRGTPNFETLIIDDNNYYKA